MQGAESIAHRVENLERKFNVHFALSARIKDAA
jgi:hypothetical protein